MTQEEIDFKRAMDRVIKLLVGMMVILFVLALLASCKQIEYVPVIEHRTDTTFITKWQRDSVWLHDSIMVTEKGDTVRIEKWHTKYIESIRHDTLYQSKIDSIPVPVPVIQTVEKELSWWQRTQMYAGNVLLIGLLILLGYGGYRLWKVFHFF
jgi:hypothetical protein